MEQSKVLQEEKQCDWLTVIIKLLYKGICFCLKFSIYLVLSFLQMIIDICYNLMDFDNWSFLNARQDERLLEIEVDENSTRHEYKVKRGKEFTQKHDEIAKLLKVNSNSEVVIDNIISNDILQKVDIIVYESEKNALRQGYKFARETKCILEDGEIYSKYIESRVMRGE